MTAVVQTQDPRGTLDTVSAKESSGAQPLGTFREGPGVPAYREHGLPS